MGGNSGRNRSQGASDPILTNMTRSRNPSPLRGAPLAAAPVARAQRTRVGRPAGRRWVMQGDAVLVQRAGRCSRDRATRSAVRRRRSGCSGCGSVEPSVGSHPGCGGGGSKGTSSGHPLGCSCISSSGLSAASCGASGIRAERPIMARRLANRRCRTWNAVQRRRASCGQLLHPSGAASQRHAASVSMPAHARR